MSTTTTDNDANGTMNTETGSGTGAAAAVLPAQAGDQACGRTTGDPAAEARAAALLDAGAVLPAGTSGRDDADALTARTYTHPTLGDRPVVRLVPATLGEAEDLALEFLGLSRAAEAPVVGQVRRETLGFPAWALVNDPANGHHALALVKDIERLGRQARTRAGAAKEGFDELGTRLGRAVPHFLPTYYEQVARLFLQAENTVYAASFFGKAREAERVHGLVVDEDRQRAVFLEFAFAGALTVKALRQYVRDLAARLDPADAWAQFRRLLVERCAAGMPPYAALPQDVRALVKAAGLDRESAERDLVADLIGSPGVVRAPASFWTAYRPAVVALAQRDPAVRARLLGFFPETFTENGSRGADAERGWLTLLAESGAEDLLTALPAASGAPGTAVASASGASGLPGSPGEGAPAVSPADWLARWEAHRRRNRATVGRSPETLALVARAADRLRADGRPVELFQGRWQRNADLDILDLCLASGVPVAEPDDEDQGGYAPGFPLDNWLTDKAPGARDLTALDGHPAFRALLSRTVGQLGGGRGQRVSDTGMARLAAHPVLSVVLREWLTARAEEYTASRGLPGLQSALNKLSGFRPVAAEVAPEAVRRIKAHDVVPLLAATLRTGIPDEMGWPALDETYAELAAEADAASAGQRHRTESVGVTGAWPALILNTFERAVVVGPEGVLLRHTLRLPATLDRWRTLGFRYVDGELLVIWWEDGNQRGYWSHRPAEVFTVGGEQIPRWGHSGASDEVCLPLPGGGRATGGKALHAGDTSLPPQRAVISDGTGHWRDGHQGKQRVWLEYDPATGTHGRASLPAFLRSGVQDGTRLLTEHCQVLPLQPGLENTPFGTDGTVLGRWVRRTVTEPGAAAPADGHRIVAGTPDGRTVTLPYPLCADCAPVPLGALALPGGSLPVLALHHRSVEARPADTDGTGGTLWSVTPDSSGGNDAAGTPYVPPVSYWHALRPRDEHGSAALRALTDSRAGELFKEVAAAVARHREASRAVEEYTGPSSRKMSEQAVARALPEVTDVRLLAGVTGLVRNAVDRAAAAVRYVTPPEPAQPVTPRNTARTQGMFFDHAPEHGDDTTLREATAFGSERLYGGWWGGGLRWTIVRQILAVNHVLGGEAAFGQPVPSTAPFTPVDGWQRDEFTVPAGSLSWTSLLDQLPELAYRAVSSALSPEHRAGLLVLLDTLAAGPLADPAGTVRQVDLIEPYSGTPGQGRRGPVHRLGQVLRKGARTVVVIAERGRNINEDVARWLALDHDPTGVFGPVAGFTLDRERVLHEGMNPDRLTRLTALLREQGPAPWRPEAAEEFHAATGIGPLQAVALLSAAVAEPGADALALLGSKTRAFEAAQARLDALPGDERHALLRALLPTDPAELWTKGPDVEAAAEVWRERLGSLVRVPEELDLDLSGTTPGAVDLVLNAGSRNWLTHGTDVPDGTGRPALRRVGARGSVASALTALRTLAYTLPYGHPLRAHLPAGLAALRSRLADPALVLDLGLDWTEEGKPIGVPIRAALGLPESGGADADGLVRAGAALLLGPGHGYGNHEKLLIRPAGLTGPDDPAFGLVEGTTASRAGGDFLALRALLEEETEALVSAGLPDGSAAAGGTTPPEAATSSQGAPHPGHLPYYPAQDPTRAVPELVAEAAGSLGLSADAAALYLMLLTLPDPADRNCVRWTEWKPARVKKARAELAATDLVVEAKRSRAGRTLFLPCGWMERNAPALPLETWKEGLYPVVGSVRTMPHLPLPALFAAAWARVRGGDAPAFEELDTRTSRKGRRR
ncbi:MULTISPECIES: hypothetical protein [unclassified Streptomyces]|uniref:hypothetical protein n=1 Tax=unclassified Streptomyces TaxID=2593676 RepID=UPI000823D515|nr:MULTISPECIES: hypothetical protein [unclassified Streptomyces]MYT96365.1 hypothetical protein [Streptomyces sp. SID8350]SCK56718.1 hypothetical protein YUWDRAFT_05145 [Streptomyces sp. AmelKG-D3]